MRNILITLIIGLLLGTIIGLTSGPVRHSPSDRHGPPAHSNSRANR